MPIIIVTSNGRTRNLDLLKLNHQVTVFKGHDGSAHNYHIDPIIDQESNYKVLGRKLTRRQAAAVVSHYEAQKSVFSEWACFLEDDAIISLDVFHLKELLFRFNQKQYRKPVVVLLYSGFGGIYSRFTYLDRYFLLGKVKVIPTGAVGYLMNRNCMDIVRAQKRIVGTPDWPTWSSKVNFIQVFPAPISHSVNLPSIYNPTAQGFDTPPHRRQLTHSLLGILRPNLVSCYGGMKCYFKLVIKPMLIHKSVRASNKIRDAFF